MDAFAVAKRKTPEQLTKRVIEAALDGEVTDHLGYQTPRYAARTVGFDSSCSLVPVSETVPVSMT